MKVFRSLLAVLMLSTLLTGCWGLREIEHMIYINSVGVDYKDGKVILYAQLVSFINIAKKEAGAQAEREVISIAKAEGETFDQAGFNLYATAQQQIAWSHVKTLLFSEAALNEKVISQVLDVWDRYYEFRYTNWVFATKDPIESIFYATPVQNISVIYSRLNAPNEVYSQSSDIEPIYLFDFIRTWNEKSQTMKLPFLKVTSNWTENKKVSPKLEVNGVGFLHNSSYKGFMPKDKIRGLRWINTNTKRTSLPVKADNAPAAVIVMEDVKSSIIPTIKEGKAVFRIKVSTQGNIPQLTQNLTQKKLEQLAVEEIKKEIKEAYLEGLAKGIDVFNLSEALFRSNPRQWHNLEQNGELDLEPGSLEEIEVNAQIFSGGISKIKRD
ncbi:Ger(x)C family spore germination protein [Paenibacillus thalictri]|uniref:Ger(X)C family spore germination protein n=1 Tax=Paenibacillus thalictri TaxID=2527873 RepID=A0A4Q9DLL5_9BACL|nr:Ger(x)C family spore germination protein [Paenibacillus thalictri]TBL74635.1 Ger(x)C family spore germination protein [Paenibacillus thalictri]